MKRIEPNNTKEIEKFENDEIRFPNIDYSSNGELNLNRTTLLAAYTTISNRVDKEYISDLEWDPNGDIDWQNKILKHLSDTIYEMIGEFESKSNDFLLEKIFIWIQLWGGNSGRGIFIRGEQWPRNFNGSTYLKAINKIQIGKYTEALEILNTLYGVSTAFSTKHIHFWSKKDAPIYDSIIAAIIFGRNPAQIRAEEYLIYIESLKKLSKELKKEGINTSSSSIERNLFNWANSENGLNWRKIRLE
jgi:hypothetical protein